MARRGKRYRTAAARIEPDRLYDAAEAAHLVRLTSTVSFDPTVELAARLGIDPRKADQMVRGSVSLPRGTGRDVRVAVVADGEQAEAARAAGADVVGSDEVIAKIEAEDLDFDVVVATPDKMAAIGRYGKVLGPRGLMPNPKSGTVTADVAGAVDELKAGRVEYRTDRGGNVHVTIGKASFEPEALHANLVAVVDELLRARPSSAKGRYLRSLTVATTMGPSVPLDPGTARAPFRDDVDLGPAAEVA